MQWSQREMAFTGWFTCSVNSTTRSGSSYTAKKLNPGRRSRDIDCWRGALAIWSSCCCSLRSVCWPPSSGWRRLIPSEEAARGLRWSSPWSPGTVLVVCRRCCRSSSSCWVSLVLYYWLAICRAGGGRRRSSVSDRIQSRPQPVS